MCTVKSPTQIMVCDVSRDQVHQVVEAALGEAASFQLVEGEGPLVTCLDPTRVDVFQDALEAALE